MKVTISGYIAHTLRSYALLAITQGDRLPRLYGISTVSWYAPVAPIDHF